MYRKKFVWLIILMVWVGMVTSIILYQEDYELANSWGVSSNDIEIIESTDEIDDNRVNYTQSKEGESESFFVKYRLERDKARSEQLDIYRELINNPNTDKTTKEEAQKQMINLTRRMEKEMEIESLVRARGFKDALAYIHEQSVDVIIQTSGLNKNDVAVIGDIIVKTTGFNSEDVTIIEKNS